ncbi:glucose/galactose transporter [Chitinophaga terrae (ex Kim and Jung 2007)]|uniref:Glucose/galactose transporter n=1 Tax=Chitinophaga terrae (ex Kim and Jung 2007) TaxID=408074 RepID=A0A1H4DZP8_9BACT|nr:sugar MFS transporter [Chitinophaga terrae (ex Kim and Jung 2007)]MDQ0104923.1 glucose/galactose transporter [Chitinophaga terrae (ex Kim and Jung 2007)]GEP91258.1 glucose/galactose MFS transporter [Chitinophaga terrae (ex Kim and Jung 2007)]SEA78047.1 glucose/galactose transporter [Chitinophaga terrae (ex Kim and Jung 2007)]
MPGDKNKNGSFVPIVIIAIMFFIFGMVTWVNAILIPYFKVGCELNNFESYLVAFAFYIAYLVMAIPAGYLLKRAGYRKGMMVGFWLMAAGTLLFVPAGIKREYHLFLSGLFAIGLGLAILQTAANPYITILGQKERAAQRFSIMGICNKLAGILAPVTFASFLIKPGDNELLKNVHLLDASNRAQILDELISRVIVPYAILTGVLLLFGLFIRYSPLPEIENSDGNVELEGKKSILDFPHLVLGAIAIFFHVGSQVIAVDSIINYTASMGMPLIEAKVFPSYILTTTIIGYLVGISIIPRFISQLTALRVCTILGFVLSVLVVLTHGNIRLLNHTTDISVWFMILLGLANSMIWAGIWAAAMDRLGTFVKTGASLLVMGLCGNAIMPLIYGWLADRSGLQFAYIVLLPCYLYLIFYAFTGYNLKRWKRTIKRNYEIPESV